MSQSSSDKFLYFTVGLLKGSEALEALRQDAVKHHMIDHPGQLIALRLTEYYESRNQGQGLQQVVAPAPTTRGTTFNETDHPRSEQRPVDRMSAPDWRSAPAPTAEPSFEASPATPAPAPTPTPAPAPAHTHVQPYRPQTAPATQANSYAQQYTPSQTQTRAPVQSSSGGQAPQPTYGSVQRNQVTGRMRALLREGDSIVSTSTNADQNADEAADYWSTL